jgi:hypothetical protein
MVYKTVCSQMANDVACKKTACLIIGGPRESDKHFSLIGKLGNFVGMGIAPRLAADVLERIEGLRSDGVLTCKMAIYQILRVGRVRDLLSVPPERRALAEERLPNNMRRITVDALARERVQGLTEVMLLLERATKVADGVAGHMVIEISTHEAPSRTAVCGSMVGRAVLFEVSDDVEKGPAEPALQQLTSLLRDRINGVRELTGPIVPGTPGGAGGAGMGLAGSTPLLHIVSTLLDAEDVLAVSVLITLTDTAEEEAHRRNLEALSAANRILRPQSAVHLPRDCGMASGAELLGSIAGASDTGAPLPLPSWSHAWESTLRGGAGGSDGQSPLSPNRAWSRSSSRSSSMSPPKTTSHSKSPSSTSDREVRMLGGGPEVGETSSRGELPWEETLEDGNAVHGASPDTEATILFRRPGAEPAMRSESPAGQSSQERLSPDGEARRARQRERKARHGGDNGLGGLPGEAPSDKWNPSASPGLRRSERRAGDGDGESTRREAWIGGEQIARGGAVEDAEDGFGALANGGAGVVGGGLGGGRGGGEGGNGGGKDVGGMQRLLAAALRRAAAAEQELHTLHSERKFQQLESEAVSCWVT